MEFKEILKENKPYGVMLDAYLDRSLHYLKFIKINLAVMASIKGDDRLRSDRPMPVTGKKFIIERNQADEYWLAVIEYFKNIHSLVLDNEEKDWFWFLTTGEARGAVSEYQGEIEMVLPSIEEDEIPF